MERNNKLKPLLHKRKREQKSRCSRLTYRSMVIYKGKRFDETGILDIKCHTRQTLGNFAPTTRLRRFPHCRRIVDDKSYHVIILVLLFITTINFSMDIFESFEQNIDMFNSLLKSTNRIPILNGLFKKTNTLPTQS